ncbi:EamA family transporter RarD [Vibrio sp. S4M6]|uniref:EamA family transporter RarD n=1 Tax=Vibrio sinus TaxID=2946865 RepID=UPI002029B6B7|nr:EamA family transporter RarD [Vibrio sinus]MCL9779984.1 EamA family transporter RarD [Vibrio sinus]
MNTVRFGNILAALSFVAWGLTPLYYQFLPNASTEEMLAVRIIASVPLLALLTLLLRGSWPNIKQIIADKRSLWYAFLASLIYCVSWYTFTWAITNEHVLQASLAFFISPITMVALGYFAYREPISLGKFLAVAFAIVGVMYQLVLFGHVPYLALSMAVCFTIYSWFKKKISYSWETSLFVEALTLVPFALLFLLYKQHNTGLEFTESGWGTAMLYLGAAPVTILPLALYSMSMRMTDMSNIGLMQYIEPSLQFLLAVIVFGEAFDYVKAVSFGFIWIGLLFIIVEPLIKKRLSYMR